MSCWKNHLDAVSWGRGRYAVGPLLLEREFSILCQENGNQRANISRWHQNSDPRAYIEHSLLLHVMEEAAARCVLHRDADEICGKEDFLQDRIYSIRQATLSHYHKLPSCHQSARSHWPSAMGPSMSI